MESRANIPGSFRDPSGFVFLEDQVLYRQVNAIYQENYDCLLDSGLYDTLVEGGLLIPHMEDDLAYAQSDEAYKIIRPELIPFVSYPYEWSFSQLKAAALATLQVQKKSLDFGMSLKDCSAYNIQFRNAKPIFVDTLSFEKYCEGHPWVAYRQFCQHFLAPLALMSYTDVRLNQLLRIHLDGISLDLTSSLLPSRSWLVFPLLFHIHLHAKSQKHLADRTVDKTGRQMSQLALQGVISNLESIVSRLRWQPRGTQWADYYTFTNYSSEALEHKKRLVAKFLDRLNPHTVWDLGANVGLFSRIASGKGIQIVAFDNDPAAIEQNYLQCVRDGETNLLPLLLDLTNPSPGIGWENEERMSLVERGPADTVLALALVHHLSISNNVPLEKIAAYFNNICHSLIIEFVPKSDPQAQRLLSARDDIFTNYTQLAFEAKFGQYFTIEDSSRITDTQRTLYLMKERGA